MRNAVRRWSPRGTLIPEVLNGGTSARTILNVEVAAAGVKCAAPRVRHERAPAFGEPTLELCFKRSIVCFADCQSVVEAGPHPGHWTRGIHGCGRSPVRESLTGSVPQTRVRQAATDAAHVSHRDHRRLGEFSLVLNVPLVRIRIFVVRI